MTSIPCPGCKGAGHETVTRSWAGNNYAGLPYEITLAERPTGGNPPMEYDVQRVCIRCNGKGSMAA